MTQATTRRPPHDDDVRAVGDLAVVSDDDSFEAVYTDEHPALRAWLAQQARDADPDDLAAEVFTRALRGWDSYRGEASRRSWLWSIARNTVRNWRRSRARDRSVVTDDPPEHGRTAAIPAEEVAAVSELLGRLDGDTARRAVYLRYVEGRTVDEVAAELDMTPTAVTSLTHRALASLRRELDRR